MKNADVLVLGGGPAGAATAILLARAGASVVVAERAAFPRDKVCGEFVSPEGVAVLGRLGVLDALIEAGAARYDACRLVDRRGRAIDAPLPSLPGIGREAIGISRAALDHALLEAARRAGARILERTEAAAPIVESGKVVGARLRRVKDDTAFEAVRATVVVAADGRRSIVQRTLLPGIGDPRRSTDRSWFGLKTHVPCDPPPTGRRIELHLFDGGYAGLGAVEGGRLNLCMLVRVSALRACEGSPDRLLRERLSANPILAEHLSGAPARGEWKSIGPLRFGAREPSLAGAILVGDAAGTIDPFSGEGMSNALAGAELAAPFALAAAAAGGLSDRAAADYAGTWRRAFGPVTRRVRLLARLFEHPRAFAAALALGARFRGLVPPLVAATRTGPSPR